MYEHKYIFNNSEPNRKFQHAHNYNFFSTYEPAITKTTTLSHLKRNKYLIQNSNRVIQSKTSSNETTIINCPQ